MVTPAARRAAAHHVMGVLGLTERRACRLAGISRTVARYASCRRPDDSLRSRLWSLAEQYPRYGHPTLHDMLVEEGLARNRKRTYWSYREERPQVRTKKRKKLRIPGVCIGQVVDTSISGARVARLLDDIIRTRGRPRVIVSDNGPEFTGKAMFFWSQKSLVRLQFIQPGKPTQNAFVESFNEVRPHRSLNRRPPAVFARQALDTIRLPTFAVVLVRGYGQRRTHGGNGIPGLEEANRGGS